MPPSGHLRWAVGAMHRTSRSSSERCGQSLAAVPQESRDSKHRQHARRRELVLHHERIDAVAVVTCSTNAALTQWRAEDGGNGHYYDTVVSPTALTWETARDSALALGGHLATLTPLGERGVRGARDDGSRGERDIAADAHDGIAHFSSPVFDGMGAMARVTRDARERARGDAPRDRSCARLSFRGVICRESASHEFCLIQSTQDFRLLLYG